MAATARPALIIPALGSFYDWLSEYAYPLFRFAMGIALVPHGLHTLFGTFTVPPTKSFLDAATWLTSSGWISYIGLLEVVGGICIAIGFLTRFLAAQVVIVVLIALFAVHLPNGYFWTARGAEWPLSWLVFFLGILLYGGGRLSVDRAIGKEL